LYISRAVYQLFIMAADLPGKEGFRESPAGGEATTTPLDDVP
jgi:hypothetical protein